MILGEAPAPASMVAWYALIIGSAGLIVAIITAITSIYVAWRDSMNLKLTVTPVLRPTVTAPYLGLETNEPFIVINAANVGRRPIHLKGFPLFTQRGKIESVVAVGEWQPSSELTENKCASFIAILKDIDLTTLTEVLVNDETGRDWSQKITIIDNSKVGEA